MSLKVKSVETKSVMDLSALPVFTAASRDKLVLADVEAQRLLDENPDCQIPFGDLRDAIVRIAVKHGLGVEFSDSGRRISN